MKPESMDNVFHALASGSRRRMLDIVRHQPGCRVVDLSGHFDVSRIAVMKHLKVLEEAQLIVSRKQGRRRELFFNAVPIQLIYDRWTTEYSQLWAQRATDIKFRAEAKARKREQGESDG